MKNKHLMWCCASLRERRWGSDPSGTVHSSSPFFYEKGAAGVSAVLDLRGVRALADLVVAQLVAAVVVKIISVEKCKTGRCGHNHSPVVKRTLKQ